MSYKPNKFEEILMEENYYDSAAAIKLAYHAQLVMTYIFLTPYQHDNNGDSFRHCYWSSMIAKNTSPYWAFRWTNAHEQHQSSENIRRRMDEHNNSIGINLIKNNPNLEAHDLMHLCLELVKTGKLKVIQNNTLVPSNLNGFILPNIFDVIKEAFNEVLDLIIKYYKELVLVRDSDSNTALHRCILENYSYGFYALLESKIIDVNTPGLSGWSPLMVCSREANRVDFVRVLLGKNLNVDYQEPIYGETALMMAAAYGNREIVELLLSRSNKKLKSFSGLTAYDKALAEEHTELLGLLK
ncbi:MAG: ankyrin repeat domain-containing protein [Bacteriovoracaceae bacterium]